MAAIVTALLVAGCSATPAVEESSAGGALADLEPITIVLSDQAAEGSYVGEALLAMVDQIEKESEGKIAFEVYLSASLLAAPEHLAGIGSGIAQMGQVVTNYYPDQLPNSLLVGELGYLPSASFPLGLVEASAALSEMFESDILVDELASQNIKVLNASGLFANSMICNQPADGLEGIEGKRVRVSSPVFSAEVEAFGGVPVNLPFTETYEGLQRGAIDCVALDPPNMLAAGLQEVGTNFYPTSMSAGLGNLLAINLEFWDALAPEYQEIIQRGGDEFWQTKMELIFERYAEFATDSVEEFGITVGPVDELNEMIAARHQQVAGQIAGRTPDAPQLVEEFTELLAKWHDLLISEYDYEETAADPDEVLQSYIYSAGLDLSEIATRLDEARSE